MSSKKKEKPSLPFATHDEIAECAYLIWEHEGRPEGRENDHWQQATLQLSLSRMHDGANHESQDDAGK